MLLTGQVTIYSPFQAPKKPTLESIKKDLKGIPFRERIKLELAFRKLVSIERWGYTLFDEKTIPDRAVSGIWFIDPEKLQSGWQVLEKHRDKFPISKDYLLLTQPNGTMLIHKGALLARLRENIDVLHQLCGQ